MVSMGKSQFPGEVLPAAPVLQALRACDDVGLEHEPKSDAASDQEFIITL